MIKIKKNKILTGHLENVLYTINERVKMYKRHNLNLYFGITNNIEVRAKKHFKNKPMDWDRMVVLYKTSSDKYVRETEGIFTAIYFEEVENKVVGGAGRKGEGKKYLYLLMKKKIK